eukprot:6207700-Pleurochrysis_carterae.AAC.1
MSSTRNIISAASDAESSTCRRVTWRVTPGTSIILGHSRGDSGAAIQIISTALTGGAARCFETEFGVAMRCLRDAWNGCL